MKNTTSLLPGIVTVVGLGLLPLVSIAQDTPPGAVAPAPKSSEAPAPKSAEAPAPSAVPAAAAPAPAAPAAPALSEKAVLMTIDGTPVTVLDVRELFTARYGRQFEQMPPEQRAMIEPQIQQMVMDELIQKTLLMNASDKEGMKAEPAEIEESLKKIAAQIPEGETLEKYAAASGVSLDRIREQITIDTKIRKLYEKITVDVTKPEAADVKKYFDEHPEEFTQKASVAASHILISTQGITDEAQLASKEKIAKELRAELVAKKGENFAEMAGLHSDCPSKAEGGSLGEFEKGQMVPEFETAAFTQETGAIGEIVKTQFGYHIIKVDEKKEAKAPEFATVQEEIATNLFEQRKSEKMGTFVEGLRAKAKIIQTGAPEAPAAGTPAGDAPPEKKEETAPGKAPAPKEDAAL